VDRRARSRLLTLVSLAVGCRSGTVSIRADLYNDCQWNDIKTIRTIRCRTGEEAVRTVLRLMRCSIRLGDTIFSGKFLLRRSHLLCLLPARHCQHEVLTHRFHRCRQPTSRTGRHQLRRQLSVPKGMCTNTNTHTEYRLTRLPPRLPWQATVNTMECRLLQPYRR